MQPSTMIRTSSSSRLFNLLSTLLLLLSPLTVVAADWHLDGNPFDVDQWWVVLDGIMGGQSSGFLEFTDDNQEMVFYGNVVVEGGGFSSLRREMDPSIDLSEYAGIVLELEPHVWDPDNIEAPLGVHLDLDDDTSSWGYAAGFVIPFSDSSSTSTAVFLPMDSFTRASRMGFRCRSNDCQLDPSTINELEIDVVQQDGPFRIHFKSITAVVNATSFPAPVVTIATFEQVEQLISSTIATGGRLYDNEYQELCIAMYRSTLNTLLASIGGGMTEGAKTLVCEGLQLADAMDAKDLTSVAWSLRGTLDDLLAYKENVDTTTNSDIITSRTTSADNDCIAVTSYPVVWSAMESLTNITSVNTTVAMIPPDNSSIATNATDNSTAL